MGSESAQKVLHYVGGIAFLMTGALFLSVSLTGGVDGEQYVWFGLAFLGWGVAYLVVVYARPQWVGIVVR